VARRQRYEKLWETLVDGHVRQINDLITHNLDIEQFAQDVIALTTDAELVRAFWKALNEITVLDPTCGSGAFLFAALGILQPLYEACLERMRVLLDELPAGSKALPDFRQTLEDVAQHANETYYVLKRIMVGNLYGVDIMPEAVEIARLRMFLKLVGQVEDRSRLEPLPDIDFNLKAGNTLVGFAAREDVGRALAQKPVANGASQGRMVDFAVENGAAELEAFERDAADAARVYARFQELQRQAQGPAYELDADPVRRDLRRRLKALADRADRLLAPLYGVQPSQGEAYAAWRDSHQPFHWFTEFYGTMSRGGFDVIIGNPPYVEYRKVTKQYKVLGYETESCGNLYAYVIERSWAVTTRRGRFGMIVQLPVICTDRMEPVQRLLSRSQQEAWLSNFDDRPGKLFDGLEHIRATIICSMCAGQESDARIWSTRYNRWYSDTRPVLFAGLQYVHSWLGTGTIPKAGSETDSSIFERFLDAQPLGRDLSTDGGHTVYYHNAPGYWIRAMDAPPYFWNERDGEKVSSHVKSFQARCQLDAAAVIAALNSSLFYWWFLLRSNCRDLTKREIETFPLGLGMMTSETKSDLAALTETLMADLRRNATRKTAVYKATGRVEYDEFSPSLSKPIIDEIDRVLARHYGFTDEELDYIINYDIKYRMGDALYDDQDDD